MFGMPVSSSRTLISAGVTGRKPGVSNSSPRGGTERSCGV